ncbi:MAG: aromatic amino acid lyase [Gammaproteobacteria bacterium]|nr:aromatic amino acid lyase [Gammaproteobacteria bacterium]
MSKFTQLGLNSLSIEDIICVARNDYSVAELANDIKAQVDTTAQWVSGVVESIETDRQANGKAYYGINTGIGALAGKTVLTNKYLTKALSYNLITSHAIAVGNYLDEEIVRAAMLIRAQSLTKGYSGVRPIIIEKMIEMLNNRVYPAIPEKGSLGASGDLAALSHLVLTFCKMPTADSPDEALPLDPTDGEVFVPVSSLTDSDTEASYYHITTNHLTRQQTIWRRVDATQGMTVAGGEIELQAKEGLALINGTMFSSAIAALALSDAENLLDHAELSLSMTLEGIRGFRDPFFPQIHQARGHDNAGKTADQVLKYIEGSQFLDPGDQYTAPQRVPPQDPYSIRCAPQVFGTIRDTLKLCRQWIETEINAATGNPLIFMDLPRDYKTVSGGNFHAEPIAMAMDFLAIAMTELGNITERRIFKLTDYHPDQCYADMVNKLDPKHGLNRFLIDDCNLENEGLHSGLMILQYTAASLVSDCKTLAHPDSVDSIPSSANQEDHVSMSLNAARHARAIIENVEQIIAIEYLCATQAIYLQWTKNGNQALHIGKGTNAAYHCLRDMGIEAVTADRVLYPELKKVVHLIRNRQLITVADSDS